MKIFDKKNFIKSLIYRVYAFIITFIIAYIISGDVELSATIGIAENIFKILSYYWFDLIWDRITKKKYKNSVILLTGLSGAGKTTIAKKLIEKLNKNNHPTMLLDGDEIRDIFKNNGFDKESRINHTRDVGKMAIFLQKQGITPIISLISPYTESRDYIRNISNDFVEIYVNTSLEECEKRDVKGLYAKARKGEINNFTGIHENSPYEIPKNPEITIDTKESNVNECVNKILKYIKK